MVRHMVLMEDAYRYLLIKTIEDSLVILHAQYNRGEITDEEVDKALNDLLPYINRETLEKIREITKKKEPIRDYIKEVDKLLFSGGVRI